MNEVSQCLQTPIEIALGVDENNQTTAKKLYAFLELDSRNYSRWCKTNITDNPYATENTDYWAFVPDEERAFNPNPTMDYRLTASFAKKLSMVSKTDRGEQAREYFKQIEEKVKQTFINRQELSLQAQFLLKTAESIAVMEIRQNQQAEQIKALDTTVSTMKEIMTEPLGDWKNDIKKRVVRIAQALNKDYKDVYSEMYGQLEVEARISLSRRCDSKKARMEKAGNTKAAIKEGTTKLAIIYDDQKLRIIFENIVKKWAMRYCA